ncbi:hypothetical protein SISNIDRAFT_470335 [Sistotremastrum niveocremeum HHB9708]|uniref:Uncharacterized protein n=1 Tax=Sistotremastrum niveocremeum HHB9708 TaxID=1314777 RepID=A0A164NYE7_9AGAM|nr:hypothetical protein SISNIDRAFT_470335 [Sistotremastrum niveocremeum HHB9708]
MQRSALMGQFTLVSAVSSLFQRPRRNGDRWDWSTTLALPKRAWASRGQRNLDTTDRIETACSIFCRHVVTASVGPSHLASLIIKTIPHHIHLLNKSSTSIYHRGPHRSSELHTNPATSVPPLPVSKSEPANWD